MIMINMRLVQVLQRVLKKGYRYGDNYKFYCPVCNHHKHKLQICVNKNSEDYGYFHCWVCDLKGGNLFLLFNKIGVSKSSHEYLTLKQVYDKKQVKYKEQLKQEQLVLPQQYYKLYPFKSDVLTNRALSYLNSRNISQCDIIKYNIGFCKLGQYEDRIILPSYDLNGNLNYFVSRSINQNQPIKYKNPNHSKDIIFNQYMINFNDRIVLVQGVFDAIAIRYNAIPLLGKQIRPYLMSKLKQYKPKVFVCLDKDAQLQAIKLADKLSIQGIQAYIVQLEDKDPSNIGYDNMQILLEQTYKKDKKFNYQELITYKLNSLFK